MLLQPSPEVAEAAADAGHAAAEGAAGGFNAGEVIIEHVSNSSLEHPLIHLPKVAGIDLSVTKHVLMLWIVATLLFLIVTITVRRFLAQDRQVPGRFMSLLEILVEFVRDSIVRPNVGNKWVLTWTPVLLTLFLFIFGANLIGVIPIFDTLALLNSMVIHAAPESFFARVLHGGVTATGNFNVTAGLATVTPASGYIGPGGAIVIGALGTNLTPAEGDAAIIGEPTGNAVVRSSRGVARIAVDFSGTPAHSSDPARGEKLAAEGAGLYLDYSKNRITDDTLRLLVDLARACGLREQIDAMFRGDRINTTEGRAVLHVALRAPRTASIVLDGENVVPRVHEVLDRMEAFADQVRDGRWRGHTGLRVRTVVNVGIGGSDLGPVMAYEALRHYSARELTFRFVSNVDGTDFAEATRDLDPAETLFIISSKTFGTLETMTNAHSARAWTLAALAEGEIDADAFLTGELSEPQTHYARESGVAFCGVTLLFLAGLSWRWIGAGYLPVFRDGLSHGCGERYRLERGLSCERAKSADDWR